MNSELMDACGREATNDHASNDEVAVRGTGSGDNADDTSRGRGRRAMAEDESDEALALIPTELPRSVAPPFTPASPSSPCRAPVEAWLSVMGWKPARPMLLSCVPLGALLSAKADPTIREVNKAAIATILVIAQTPFEKEQK